MEISIWCVLPQFHNDVTTLFQNNDLSVITKYVGECGKILVDPYGMAEYLVSRKGWCA